MEKAKSKYQRLLSIGFLTAVSASVFVAASSPGLMTDILNNTNANQLLNLSLNTSELELEEGDSYEFTAYGEYSTQTIEVNVYWSVTDGGVGELDCGEEKSKTCTFKALEKGKAVVTATKENNGTTFEETVDVTVTEEVVNPYSDELPDWADSSIVRMTDEEIFTGYADGSFGAGDSLTHGQLLVVLGRVMNAFDISIGQDGADCDLYPDVASTHYAYDAICDFYHQGWVDTEPGEYFYPDEEATRGLASHYIAEALFVDSDVEIDDIVIGEETEYYFSAADFEYSDEDVDDRSIIEIIIVSDASIMTGYFGTDEFGALNYINRAETAVVMDRLFTWLATDDVDDEDPL